MSNKVFEIQVPETWIQTYIIVADNKEEAIKRVQCPTFFQEAVIVGELELSHSNDTKDWDIKELKPDEIPEWLKL